MNSLKTAVVVTVLLGVMYAVYTTLTNHPTGSALDGAGSQWPTVDVQIPGGPANPSAPRAPWDTGAKVAPSPTPNWQGGGAGPTRDGPPSRPESPKFGPSSPLAPGPTETAGPPNRSDPIAPPRPSHPLDPPAAAPREPDDDSARPAEHRVREAFTAMMAAAQVKLDRGELADVLSELSRFYGNPDLTRAESSQLLELLDQLAGTVIYSRKHLLERPYRVREGETLEQIAEQCRVPWQLLAKINGIRDPNRLVPGRELKVVRGPFEAVVSLERHELALFVDDRYAGRFPIGVGRDQPRLEGTYTVKEKLPGRPYQGSDGDVAADDPKNPLGRLWIGLDGALGIHGADSPRNLGRDDNRGAICLGERDIEDVYDILSCGSQVTIRR